MKMNQFADIKPSQIGLSPFFTLDKTSKIREIYCEQRNEF